MPTPRSGSYRKNWTTRLPLYITLDLKQAGNTVTGLFDQTTFWSMAQIRQGSLRGTNLQLEVTAENRLYAVIAGLQSNRFTGTYRMVEGEEHGAVEGRRVNLLPPETATTWLAPLWEYRRTNGAGVLYSFDPGLTNAALKRTEEPVCRVWREPVK
ncbi:MAG: hypothetical protein HZA90_09400 [Verrucomicrobia bacterium]|nr:hypothetical protein [Verrucomicrobiota bacterium]